MFLATASFVVFGLALMAGLYNFVFGKKPKSLAGRHVLVTGGSAGIGRAVANQAASAGANVTIVARNLDRLKETAEAVKTHFVNPEKQKVHIISTDISSRETTELTEKLSEASQMLGPVYLLVNCAGISIPGRFEDLEPQTFYDIMDVNFFGSVNVTRAVLPTMKAESRGGTIVFVSSMAGLFGIYGYTAYTASKFALRGFAECLEMELKPHNIDVMLMCPPDTDTPGFEAEEKTKPEETRLIAQSAGLFQPEKVAQCLLQDALNGVVISSPGLDGWLLKTVCTGMSNASVTQVLIEAIVLGPLRIVGWCYKMYFNSIVMKCKRKKESGKRKEE